jgi:Ca-activated chloride channel family protein
MSFDAPGWLACIAVAVLLAWTARRRERRDRSALRAWSGADASVGKDGRSRRRISAGSELVGAALIAAALAQPRCARETAAAPAPACIFVLDASRSMLARDVVPDRFGAARAAILAEMERDPARRFGVVTFAGAAEEVARPTADRAALAALLAELDPRRIASPGSDVAPALGLALDRLESSEQRGEIRVISDGDWDDDEGARAAASRAAAAGVLIGGVTVGGGLAIEVAGADAPTLARPQRLASIATPPKRRALDHDGSGTAGGGAPWWHFALVGAGIVLLGLRHGIEGEER